MRRRRKLTLERGGGLNGGKGTGRIDGLKKEMSRIMHKTHLIDRRKEATQNE